MARVPDLDEALGADLATLVRAVGTPLVDYVALSQRGAPQRATAFQLRFADGRTCKGIYTLTARQAEQAATIAAQLSHVARILDRCGAALLTEWVDGECLSVGAIPDEILRRCGALQAAVHALPVPHADAPTPRDAVLACSRRLRGDLDNLAGGGALPGGEADDIWATAAAHAPVDCTVGLILGDFCAENIVHDADDRLTLIDIETLGIGACEYDLARTWYRWPMSAVQRRVYLDGYDGAPAAAFVAHFPYWTLSALASGAVFRHRQRADTISVPLDRLRTVMRALARGDAAIDGE